MAGDKILRDTAQYSLANYLTQGIGMVTSVALRRFMGPLNMGAWSLLQVILSYCGYASFGTTKALMRDYPYLKGAGKHDEADKLKDRILTFSMLMSVIPAAALLAYVALRGASLDQRLRAGLLFIAGFLFVQRFYDVLMGLLRSDKKFSVLSQLMVLNALGTLAVVWTLVNHWGLNGLLFGTAAVTVACFFFIQWRSPYRFHYDWDIAALSKELKLGIPLLALTFLQEVLKSMDKWVLVRRLGLEQVGLYSLAMMASAYVFAGPMMFSHVLYPNLQEAYGQRGSAEKIKNYLIKPMSALSILCPLLSGLAIFLLPALTHAFMPKFAPGLEAMKIYLIGTTFLLVAQFSVNFLVTIDRYLVTLPILGAALLVNLALNLSLVNAGWGLEGMALGSAVSFAFYGLLCYWAALHSFASTADKKRSLWGFVTRVSLYFGVIFLIDRLADAGGPYRNAVLKSAVFLVVSAPFLLILEKETGLFGRSRAAFSPKKAFV